MPTGAMSLMIIGMPTPGPGGCEDSGTSRARRTRGSATATAARCRRDLEPERASSECPRPCGRHALHDVAAAAGLRRDTRMPTLDEKHDQEMSWHPRVSGEKSAGADACSRRSSDDLRLHGVMPPSFVTAITASPMKPDMATRTAGSPSTPRPTRLTAAVHPDLQHDDDEPPVPHAPPMRGAQNTCT